jgi:outer membrane protein insertion porin family
LDNDKGIIRQLLLDRGFLESAVSGPRVERQGKEIKVVFEIKEGSQYAIGNIIAKGDLLDDSAETTLAVVSSQKGETFNLSKARKDTFAIAEAFGDRGYAFANVVPDTRLNPTDKVVDLIFNSSKGKLVSVDSINIRGNEKTYENVIRREIKVAEGDQYDASKIKRSEERLKRLGYFQEASISTQPSLKDSSKVDLNVNVKEMNTGSFSIGAGYSTSDGAIVNGRISETNVLGTGRRADLDIDVGSIRKNVSLVLEDRRLNDTNLFGSVEGAVTERQFLDFDRQLVGGGFALGHPLDPILGEFGEDIIFSTKYQFYDVDISNVDNDAADFVKASKGKTSSGSIIPRLVRDTLDNPISPTNGSRQVLSYEKSGLGGDAKYHLFEVRNTWYEPLTTTKYGDITFSWRVSAAFGESDDSTPFPLFKRYFPGGINSVRGYQARTLGPADANGNEYGGSKEFVTNFDLIFPLLSSAGLRGVVFYDLGNGFDDDKNIRLSDLRKAYGLGLRWASPMGPLRIEFGLPQGKREGEDSLVTMFSFGAPL